MTWSGASDEETPAAGLYYCLRVGSTPDAHDVVSGTYGTPLMGNVGQCTEMLLNLPPGTYYWCVHAIDSGLMTSPWSSEATVVHCPGDLDGDGEIDASDLAELLAYYGTTGGATYQQGDMDGDGDVDLADLGALLSVYGTTCD